MKYDIPVYEPSLLGRELEYVTDCINSGWISGKGSYVQKFETEFAAYIGATNATSVSNGTVALHLALMALGIGPGDEIIVPTFTYIAPVNAAVYCGATPVFVDCDRDTWQIDPEDVKRRITKNTKAVIAVHLYGHAAPVEELQKICREHRLFLVEDCAEALGTYVGNQHVGTFGDISIFSFYGNKTITTGEGGMVVAADETLFQRAVHLKGQGLAKYREYWHDIIGYNYRMTNICAAIGLAQLEQADRFIERKRAIAIMYIEMLYGTGFEMHLERPGTTHSFWMVSALTPTIAQRDAVRQHLAVNGIETRPTFFPVHTMPMYSQRYQRHAVSENIALRGINLPSHPGLSDDDVKRIVDTMKSFPLQKEPVIPRRNFRSHSHVSGTAFADAGLMESAQGTR